MSILCMLVFLSLVYVHNSMLYCLFYYLQGHRGNIKSAKQAIAKYMYKEDLQQARVIRRHHTKGYDVLAICHQSTYPLNMIVLLKGVA